MQVSFSFFLRELRQSHGFSQALLAKQAGIGRVTLSRWENGTQIPRAVELEQVLTALQATAEEIRQATRFLGIKITDALAPQKDLGPQLGLGPRPNGGLLLGALRLRAKVSQEDAAAKAGVTVRTLRRWEKAESWPNPSQLHALCYALKAHPEEIVALTQGGTYLEIDEPSESPTLEEIYERCQTLHHYSGNLQVESLKELGFFALETQGWPLAARSVGGRQILSRIYSCHANYYSSHERWAEGAIYANRALDLLSTNQLPDRGTVQAGIAAARCAVYKGKTPSPERGMEILRHWLDAARWPDFQSWILSDMAKYQVMIGDASQSLQLARQAREAVAASDRYYDLYLRELDEARILLQAGEAAQALNISSRARSYLQPEHIIQFQLLEAESALALKSPTHAGDCLYQAQRLVNEWELYHLQPHIDRVSKHF